MTPPVLMCVTVQRCLSGPVAVPNHPTKVASDKLQDMVDSNFKLYKQITDNADFADDLLAWMFERYLKAKKPDQK